MKAINSLRSVYFEFMEIKMYVLLILITVLQLNSAEIINPYSNKNSKYQQFGGHSYENNFYSSQEMQENQVTSSEERREEKLEKMKTLLGLLKDLKDKQFRKRNMRLSDQVAEDNMIQDRPDHGPFYRVLIPHPPRPKRILLKRGKRRRRRRRKRIRRKLGLRLHNNFNFRRIRKAYKERLFTRIFVCLFNVFC